MTLELFYTSAPRGLQVGSRGFCTVAATQGIPPALVEKLESLSGYRPLFPPLDARAKLNPTAYCHVRVMAAGRTHTVLSRVSSAGLDYTERTNKFAHHIVLDADELPNAGPAWLLGRPGFMATDWDGQVRTIAAGRVPPREEMGPAVCNHWQEQTGDAGWAGVLVEAFEANPARVAYLLFEPGTECLPLIEEALTLLPPQRRWGPTFSTYFTGLPQGIPCAWRCVAKGSTEAESAVRVPGALMLDLGTNLGPARGGAHVEQARTGIPGAPQADNNSDELDGMEDTRHRHQPPKPPNGAGLNQTYTTISAPVRDSLSSMPPPPPVVGEPVPRGGFRTRSWLSGFAAGIAAGLLMAIAFGATSWLPWVATKSGSDATDETPNESEPSPHNQNAKLNPAPENKSLDQAPTDGRSQHKEKARSEDNKAAAPKAREKPPSEKNSRLPPRANVNHVHTDSKLAKATFRERIDVIGKELRKLKELKPGSFEPRDVNEHLNELESSIAALRSEAARADKLANSLPLELDRVRESLAPRTISYYFKLPPGHKPDAKKDVLPEPLVAMLEGEDKDCTLALEGLNATVSEKTKLELETRPDVLDIFLRLGKSRKPFAQFERVGRTLSFKWENKNDIQTDKEAVKARQLVANSVLLIEPKGSKKSFYFGLNRKYDTSQLPFLFNFRLKPEFSFPLLRNLDEIPTNEIYLSSIVCELAGEKRTLRALADATQLDWDQRVALCLEKSKDKTKAPYSLVARWEDDLKGDLKGKEAGQGRPTLIIHSLVVYTLIGNHRVEVWRLEEKSKE